MALITAHKCASSFVGRLLDELAVASKMTPIDLAAFAHDTSESAPIDQQIVEFYRYCRGETKHDTVDNERRFREFFQSRGYFYGPIRYPSFAERLVRNCDIKLLLMLRDPRDALTSMYFSTAYSHAIPMNPSAQQGLLKSRARARSTSIDDYLLERMPSWSSKYRIYCDLLLNCPRIALVKYEDMVTDFPAWFEQVLDFWQLRLSRRVKKHFLGKADFEVEQEDVHSHKRQVTPGDHQRKLRPETIAALTHEFQDVLVTLGYVAPVGTTRLAA